MKQLAQEAADAARGLREGDGGELYATLLFSPLLLIFGLLFLLVVGNRLISHRTAEDDAATMTVTTYRAGMTPNQVTLLSALFLRHFPKLAREGHVYVAMPPLFRIDCGKQMFYALDEAAGATQFLNAAGGIEAIATIQALRTGIVPPTINHFTDDDQIDPGLNLTFNKAQKRDVKMAMSNTFGFGGHNACILFKKYEG